MTKKIKVIINADDFGYSAVFNEKILDLLRRGIIKSTTVMVKRISPGQADQIKQLKQLAKKKSISVGLHVDFNLFGPAKSQIEEQYDKFISVFGFKPSHLDIHKFIHDKRLINGLNKFALDKSLPVRNMKVKSKTKQTTYPAFFCKKWVLSVDEVVSFLDKLADNTSCEIITHPGDYDTDSSSSLNKQRRIDYDSLVALADVLKKKKNFKVISYLEL
jgi:chitin disaccharide deacetylase